MVKVEAMLRGLLLLFVLVPLLELYLLTLIAQKTSFWTAVLITVVTGIVGGSLAKREGLKVWRRWQAALANMQVPEEGVVGGLLVLVGGVLLVTPGVLTDVVGFLLLLPASRRWLSARIRERVHTRLQGPDVVFSNVAGGGFGMANPDQHPNRAQRQHGTIDTSGTSLD